MGKWTLIKTKGEYKMYNRRTKQVRKLRWFEKIYFMFKYGKARFFALIIGILILSGCASTGKKLDLIDCKVDQMYGELQEVKERLGMIENGSSYNTYMWEKIYE